MLHPQCICFFNVKGVVAYVDIRSPFGNPGNAIAERLSSLGAFVERTRSAFVTHVIFRNGDPMTKSWAEKRGISLVTPSWVKACVERKVCFSICLSFARFIGW